MSVLLATYRSVSAALSDSSDGTFTDSTATNPGGTLQDDVPLSVLTTLAGTPGAASIREVVFRVRARYVVTGGAQVQFAQLNWTFGSNTGMSDVSLTGSFSELSSPPMQLRPDGQPWQWADLAALVGVGITAVATLPSATTATLRVSEVLADVYGTDMTADTVDFSLVGGDAGADLLSSDLFDPLLAGDAHAFLLLGASVIEVGDSFTNAASFATFQDAIDGTPAGGNLYVPPAVYNPGTIPAVVPMSITGKAIRMFSGAANESSGGARLIFDQTAQDLMLVQGTLSNGTVLDGMYWEGAGLSGSGRGIVFSGCHDLLVNSMVLHGFPNAGIAAEDSGDNVHIKIFNTRVERSRSGSLISLAKPCFSVELWMVNLINELGRLMDVSNADGCSLRKVTFQMDGDPVGDGSAGAMLYANNPHPGGLNNLDVFHCWFESVTTNLTPNNWFVHLTGPLPSGAIRRCTFRRPSYPNGSNVSLRAIKTVSTTSIGPNLLRIQDNLGVLAGGSGVTGVGTDDLDLSVETTALLSGNVCRDSTGYAKPMTIPGIAWAENDTYGMTVPQRNARTWYRGARVYLTDTGEMSVCVTAGAPGTWRKWGTT